MTLHFYKCLIKLNFLCDTLAKVCNFFYTSKRKYLTRAACHEKFTVALVKYFL